MINKLLVLACWLIVPAACKRAFVQQNPGLNTTSFRDALLDPNVDTLIFTDDRYVVGSELDEFLPRPYPLTRSITLTGLNGRETVLDLAFKRSIVHICSTCTFRFNNITVTGDRRGNGNTWDFLVGDYGSRMLIENTNKWRIACTATKDWAVVINEIPRSPLNPGFDLPQNYTLVNVTFKGKFYPDSLFNYDVSSDSPYTIQEGSSPQGGYSQWGRNVTRLCDVVIPLSCMKTKSPDVCVNEAIDIVLAERASSGHKQLLPLVAAVVVPIVVVGALAAIGIAVWVRQHRQRLAAARQQCDDSYRDAEYGMGPSGVYSVANGRMTHGWAASTSLTLQQLQESGFPLDAKITFGALLGAGSYGRVYKATWGGQVVAVKVIEHDSGSVTAVENEVQIMMCFSHPNIVRALHCITYQFEQSPTVYRTRSGSSHAAGGTSSSGTGPRSGGTHAAGGTSSSGAGIEQAREAGTGNSLSRLISANTDLSRQTDTATAAAEAAVTVDCTSKESSKLQTSPGLGRHRQRTVGSSAAGTLPGSLTVTAAAAAAASAVKKAETWVVQELCDLGTLSQVVAGLEPLTDAAEPAEPSCAADDEDVPNSAAAAAESASGCGYPARKGLEVAADRHAQDHNRQEGLLVRLLLLRDVAAGLCALHEQNVVHGDLNARNVLVSSEPSCPLGMVAKLADLGLARVINQHRTHRTTQAVGTLSHMPPELLRSGRMARACDIYAFGIMMHEVYAGEAAFKALHYGQFFEAIVLQNLRPPLLQGMPADYATLMQHCWAVDAAARPTSEQLWECLEYMVRVRGHETSADAPADRPGLEVPHLLVARPVPLVPAQQRPVPDSGGGGGGGEYEDYQDLLDAGVGVVPYLGDDGRCGGSNPAGCAEAAQ